MHSHAMDAKSMSKLIYCLLERNQYPTIYKTNFGLAFNDFIRIYFTSCIYQYGKHIS